jgi:hypothetical protein
MIIETKGTLCNMVIRPVLIYGSESWLLKWEDENMLQISERKMLRRHIGPMK